MEGTYVIRLGSALKIGRSKHIENRLNATAHEEVVALIPGTQWESELHRRLAHLRIDTLNGSREWFRDTAEARTVVESIVGDERTSLTVEARNGYVYPREFLEQMRDEDGLLMDEMPLMDNWIDEEKA